MLRAARGCSYRVADGTVTIDGHAMGFMVGVKVTGSRLGSVYRDCAAATAALVTHTHTHLLTNKRMRQPSPLLLYKCSCVNTYSLG